MRTRFLSVPAVVALVFGVVAPVPVLAGAVDCGALAPSTSATVNTQAINGCLSGTAARAQLGPGTYPIDGPLTVPSGAVLLGDSTSTDRSAMSSHAPATY